MAVITLRYVNFFLHSTVCFVLFLSPVVHLLNQARAGRRPARAWFLRIAFVREVSMRVCVCVWMCVCVSAPEAMNN